MDLESIRQSLAECDVVVEGFRPGKLAALGLGADDLHAVNPRLVICSITGLSASSLLSDRAHHPAS